MSAVLGVVEPYGSGLGGGGFFLLHHKVRNHTTMLDARERAPFEAHRDMYLDESGEVDRDRALNGPLAAGIPGLAAAWHHLAENYGQLPLQQNLMPAIQAARVGVAMDDRLSGAIQARIEVLKRYPSSSVFLFDDPSAPFVQDDLGNTLEMLATEGAQTFYQGSFAEKLVDGVRRHGGIWTLDDLAQYRTIEREPIQFKWRDAHITSAPLPSATGMMLAQVLNMLGEDWLDDSSQTSRTHRLIEALRRSYIDRAQYFGDSDHVEVPVTRLTSREHADTLMTNFDPQRATPSSRIYLEPPKEGHTTHFSILDSEGNWVSATLSVNGLMGSGFVAPGTGILLNNEMDDFSAKPGAANLYGLVGSDANAIAPGKRMLSSMGPTAVRTPDRLALLGTPGGSRITTMVLLGLLDFLQGADAAAMVSQARIHHQALPDKIFFEPEALNEDLQSLSELGHTLEANKSWGNMQVVIWDQQTQQLQAASDPRGIGSAKVHQH